MKYELINKGYVKIKSSSLGISSNKFERIYEINGKDYICLNGSFTSNGVENWFYNVMDFKIENNIIYIPEFLPNPELKIKNKDMINKYYNYSIDIKKENNYQQLVRDANIIFNKNGNGYTSTKIALPVPWIKALNIDENNRKVQIVLKNNEIIIKKMEENQNEN